MTSITLCCFGANSILFVGRLVGPSFYAHNVPSDTSDWIKKQRAHMIRSQMDLCVNKWTLPLYFQLLFYPTIPINHIQTSSTHTANNQIISSHISQSFAHEPTNSYNTNIQANRLPDIVYAVLISIESVCACVSALCLLSLANRLHLWFKTRHFCCIL